MDRAAPISARPLQKGCSAIGAIGVAIDGIADPEIGRVEQLAGAIKAGWICEQAHQQLKEELGLDHIKGQSWQGLHPHARMSMIALAFLQKLRLKRARGEKNRRTVAAAQFASNQASHH